MQPGRITFLESLILGRCGIRAIKRRRPRQVVLSCDRLEGRVTPAHIGVAHHAVAHLHQAALHAHAAETAATTAASAATTAATSAVSAASNTTTDSSSSSCSSSSSSGSTSSSALSSAQATLRSDVQTIELSSDTTVGQLAAIAAAFETLKTDGLSPSSQSALKSFENNLVTAYASGTTGSSPIVDVAADATSTTLTGNSTLLSEFEAIYTSSPTTQQTTDLTTAYNALAAAVTSSNITSADITTINTDWAAVLAAEGSTSTATFPYFELVTGRSGGPGFGPEGAGGC
jgi:trimeric autotransporter adhesin